MASSLSSARSTAASLPKRLGCEVPRVFTPELRPLTPETSLGFAVIEFAQVLLKIDLLPWQRWFLVHALEMLPDGTFRFRTIVLLVARQNGKSMMLQVLALFFMYVRRVQLVIGTAQSLDIAEEVWQGAVDMAEESPELAAEIERVNRTNGKKSLELLAGERYKVQSANRRGGRGLSGDLVLLDEVREHQSWDAWAAVTKTTLARALALILVASNAGDAASVVLRYLRKMAHLALGDPDRLREVTEIVPAEEIVDTLDDGDSLAIFEWSASPGCDVQDRGGWAQANPSLGYTITERAIAAAAKTDPEWVFRTEVLCQWWDGALEGPFPGGAWEAGIDPTSSIPPDARVVACVDMSHDRSRTHIAFAGRNAAGLAHVEVVASRAGSDWVAGWLAERADVVSAVTGQSRGAPVSGLMGDLAAAGLPVTEWAGTDLGAGTGAFYDLVRAGDLAHLPQPVLDVAAATAVSRPLGDSWVWDRKKSPIDIAPLVAATGAVWLLNRPAEKPTVSAYEERGVLVL